LLIGVSVLTTWQHHFFDIPTGLWLGCFVVWLFPTDARPLLRRVSLTRDTPRRRLALGYASAASRHRLPCREKRRRLVVAALAMWLAGTGGARLSGARRRILREAR
jgi:hypothetical protein